MRVKLAMQLLFVLALKPTNQKVRKTKNTADFVDFINKLFDCLNSRTLYSSNPYNCGLSDSGIVKPIKPFLNEAVKYFIDLQKKNLKKMTKPSCFKGTIQTITGILSFFEEEKSNNNVIGFILTNRLKDELENVLSVFRQKGGYNKNPTARTI